MRVSVNGTTLFFDVEGAKYPAEGAALREKPTVVLLHGGPGFDHSNFKPEYAQLADVAQLIYLDHRGNGRSDRDDPGSWNLETWADDVRGFCDALEIQQPIVLGWSFGGFVALLYAVRHPGHASKLLLQSTAARMDTARIAAAFERIGGPVAGAAASDFWTTRSAASMDRYLEVCIPLYHSAPLDDQLARCLLNVQLLSDGFEGMSTLDLRPQLAAVTGPVKVLAGALDPITPLAAADELATSLINAEVSLEIFDQSAHFINLSEPERFFATVRSFITS